MTSRREEEENDKKSRDKESEYLPQAGREHDESPPPPPGNENIEPGPLHAEPQGMGAIGLNEGDERWRSILQAIHQRQYYKDEARMFLSLKGQLTEEAVTSIVQHLHGVDSDSERFLFFKKVPGRMVDGDKWTRTDVEWALHDWTVLHQVKQPTTIRHKSYNAKDRDQGSSSHPPDKGKQVIKSYNVENPEQGTSSHPRDKGEQLISEPSKEKYGYLPQLYEGLHSSMPENFGNSDEVEGFLVGGKEKLQEIRRGLSCRSRARSSEENIDGIEIIQCDSPSGERKKVCSLWGVDLYEEDFKDTPQKNEHDVNRAS